MEHELRALLDAACQTAHSLFERGKTSGSSANLSFQYQDRIYITGSGTCFGTLTPADFAVCDRSGTPLTEIRPSKELPLHLSLYRRKGQDTGAVIHTHSFYAVLWSCLEHPGSEEDVIPAYTPYLGMKLGRVKLVPYAPPGSPPLFSLFEAALDDRNGYLLAHHGPVVAGKGIRDAYYALEELEESARLAWELRGEAAKQIGGQ